MAGENRQAAIDELDVNPIDEERSFAQLNDWAEASLRKAPAAPSVREKKDYEQKPAAHEKEIRIRVPVVVNGVKMDGRFVEELRECACGDSADADECESERLALFCEICV